MVQSGHWTWPWLETHWLSALCMWVICATGITNHSADSIEKNFRASTLQKWSAKFPNMDTHKGQNVKIVVAEALLQIMQVYTSAHLSPSNSMRSPTARWALTCYMVCLPLWSQSVNIILTLAHLSTSDCILSQDIKVKWRYHQHSPKYLPHIHFWWSYSKAILMTWLNYLVMRAVQSERLLRW